MFTALGTFVTKNHKAVLIGGLLFTIFAGVWGTGVFDRLSGTSSLTDPHSESQQFDKRIVSEIGRQTTDLIVLYSSSDKTVDDPAFQEEVIAAEKRIKAAPEVARVVSYYGTQAPSLLSKDRHATYVAVRFDHQDTDKAIVKEVMATAQAKGLKTQIGGARALDLAFTERATKDIGLAEGISLPVLFILLLIIFGNVVAGLMPLLIGGVAILGAFMIVRILTYFTDVSIFAVNIITILGLGLAVDYGLFIVSRYREELGRGLTTAEAINRTLATAGRTVAVSGLVVGLSLASLLIFPQVLLRSMGLGGLAAVGVAMATSLTILPAMLMLLGKRINALRLPWNRRRAETIGIDSGTHAVGWWATLAHSVMRRPVLYAVGLTILLVGVALPFRHVQFGGPDQRMLPVGTESRVVTERIEHEFVNSNVNPISVLVSKGQPEDASEIAESIEEIPGVEIAAITARKDAASAITVNYLGDSSSPEARRIVHEIRALPKTTGTQVLVGGYTAGIVDQLNSLKSRMPWMAAIMAVVTFLLLMFAFGSVVVPIKAIVMNLISIGAAFGVVVWIFQEGHLSGLLNFTPTGYIEASQPVLMVAILFGLSMDYEVFLLSRIRERYDATGDNTAAVASGVQHTGAIITAAALLLCIVVGSFSLSGITFIKMIGVGMLVAILVDATLVRLLLVPATMRLLGNANWWAPKPLCRFYKQYGFKED